VVAIGVALAAADAESVLSGLDQLDVEAPLVRAGEDAERVVGDTVVALARGVELSTLVTGVKTREVGGVDAASDLVDLVLASGARDLVECLTRLEEVVGKATLIGVVKPALGGAVGLGSRSLCNADVGMRILWGDQAHVVESIDGDDVAWAVLVRVNVGSGGSGRDEREKASGESSEGE